MPAGAVPKEPPGASKSIPRNSPELPAAIGKPASQTNHKTRGGGVCWSAHERQGLPSFRLIVYVGKRKRVARSASEVVRWSCQP